MAGEFTPVGRLATERAHNRIIGGPVTDTRKYNKYQDRVQKEHRNFWRAILLTSATHEQARGALDVAPIQRHSYIGGALLYLASQEEQAKLDRRQPPPDLSRTAAENALSEILIGGIGPDLLNNLVVGMSREVSDADSERMSNATMDNALRINSQIVAKYHDSLRASPFVKELSQDILHASEAMTISSSLRVAEFTDEESAFCEAMTRLWWSHIRVEAALGQITGAADARLLTARSMEP